MCCDKRLKHFLKCIFFFCLTVKIYIWYQIGYMTLVDTYPSKGYQIRPAIHMKPFDIECKSLPQASQKHNADTVISYSIVSLYWPSHMYDRCFTFCHLATPVFYLCIFEGKGNVFLCIHMWKFCCMLYHIRNDISLVIMLIMDWRVRHNLSSPPYLLTCTLYALLFTEYSNGFLTMSLIWKWWPLRSLCFIIFTIV